MGLVSVTAFAACALGGYILAVLIRAGFSFPMFMTAQAQWGEAKNLLKYGLTFHVPQVTGILMTQADMLIVVSLLPADKVGLYTVALAVAQGQLRH